MALILVFLFRMVIIKNIHLLGAQQLRHEMMLVWLIIWLLLVLIETNRAPFDLLEGERELIRGFNIEIGGLMFVYLFLREYGMVIMLSCLTVSILEGGVSVEGVFFVWVLLLIRSCFPRLRYDSLMTLI